MSMRLALGVDELARRRLWYGYRFELVFQRVERNVIDALAQKRRHGTAAGKPALLLLVRQHPHQGSNVGIDVGLMHRMPQFSRQPRLLRRLVLTGFGVVGFDGFQRRDWWWWCCRRLHRELTYFKNKK